MAHDTRIHAAATRPSTTSALLARIAATLGVPVQTFFGPQPAVDPERVRLLEAFDTLPPHYRRSLADVGATLVRAAAEDDAARAAADAPDLTPAGAVEGSTHPANPGADP